MHHKEIKCIGTLHLYDSDVNLFQYLSFTVNSISSSCGSVVKWLVLSPHSKNILALILSLGVFVWRFYVLPVVAWVLFG